MTQTTLEKTMSRLEREISGTSETEKAKAAQRLREMLRSAKPTQSTMSEDDDDMFNNMPV